MNAVSADLLDTLKRMNSHYGKGDVIFAQFYPGEESRGIVGIRCQKQALVIKRFFLTWGGEYVMFLGQRRKIGYSIRLKGGD